MNPDAFFSAASMFTEEFAYDSSQNKYAMEALLGSHPTDQMEGAFYLDPTSNPLNLYGFSEQYHVSEELPASLGALSPPYFPPSPLSSVGDVSELGTADAPAPHNPSFSPTEPSVFATLADTDDPKSTKTDLDGCEYLAATRKWVCTKCGSDFVSSHEARRHGKTAAKCTGKKVLCLRCGDRVHASQWSRKRHFGSKKCQKNGRKRGTPSYTANNAYVIEE